MPDRAGYVASRERGQGKICREKRLAAVYSPALRVLGAQVGLGAKSLRRLTEKKAKLGAFERLKRNRGALGARVSG